MSLPRHLRLRTLALLITLPVLWLAGASASAQLTNEQMADVLINSARKAYNEKNYPIAATKFRDYLQKFANLRDAGSARHGLALVLLEGPVKKYAEARDLLQPLTAAKDHPEYASILFHLGQAWRGLGAEELAIAQAKPQEAAQRRLNAKKNFEEAGKQFFAARLAYTLRSSKLPLDEKELPAQLEWALRARCDEAEMLLRQGKGKEAKELTAAFVKDPVLTRSRFRDFGRYLHGFGCFLAGDYPAAEATLTLLTPFAHPAYGTHARYLLARTLHQADERAEAAVHYEAVLKDYAQNKKMAAKMLTMPEMKKDPNLKAQWEEILKSPTPDHVGRAAFYWGVLFYEGGKFGEARGRFAEFAKLFPTSTMLQEAKLRLGFCQVQLREFPEALKTLTPLIGKEPRLDDQVLFWIARAKLGAAPDPSNAAAREKAVKAALDSFRQAVDKAQQLTATDPLAKERRDDMLLELADTQQEVKQYKEAAAVYNQLLAGKLTPQREQELLQRLVTALHLAGEYNESDKAVTHLFLEKYPKSILLPSVLFRYAENNYFRALAVEKNPNLPDRARTLAALHDETAKRYRVVIEKYPDFPKLNFARYGLGMTFYRKGDLDQARKTLETIPLADRAGELGVVPYVMADCLLRLAPTSVPDDALAVGKLEDQLKTAAELLDAFVNGQPNHPHLADGMLKLGYCYQRLAALQGQPPERVKLLNSAKTVYDKILKTKPANPGQAQALLERAKCWAQLGNVGQADTDLRNFLKDPWNKATIAPLAQVQLATLLRGQNRGKEAIVLLEKARQVYEPQLTKDPQRAAWVAVLRYHHGVALREAKNYAEARGIFESVVKQFPGRPEAAEAALRVGQCLKEEGQVKIEQSEKIRGTSKKPDVVAKATRLREEGQKLLRDAVAYLEGQAERLKANQPPVDARARMLYEIAWGYRELAEPEVQRARAALVEEEIKKRGPTATKLPPPEVPLARVPVQPAEQKARAVYLTLINDFGDAPLATDARFELAELYGQRHENDAAIKLLNEGLDKEPPQDLTEKLRLRLGICQAAKGNHKAALAQFNAIAQNLKGPLAAQALYRAGEALLAQKEWAEAVKRLSAFRDVGQFQNVAGVSDRALLRLGHAYAQQQNWDKSRQVYDMMWQRFGGSPWVHEARYGSGWALQQQKQYDQAIALFTRVKADTLTVTGAKAQLQIGLCRLAQKRYAEAAEELMVVAVTYDYKELTPIALLEAARAYGELKQTENARKQLQRVIREFPQTPWAETAREQLERLKGT